jgi:hypothetical protein
MRPLPVIAVSQGDALADETRPERGCRADKRTTPLLPSGLTARYRPRKLPGLSQLRSS